MPHSKIISVIDIGSSKITTVIGQYFEQDDKLNVIAVSSITATGFRKGQIINLEQAIQTITQSIESAERMAGLQIKHAYVTLAASHIQSINSQGVVAISAPNGEIAATDIDRCIEAAKAVSIPAGKEVIHIIPRKFTVDGQEGVIDPVGMNGIRLEVEAHLILASTPALKNISKCFEEIGVDIQQIIYSGLAAAQAGLTETEKELGVTIVDIGGSITSITVFNESSPCYSSVIPVGANNVTNDLAIGLRYSLDEAEKIKVRLGKIIENKKYEDDIDLSAFGLPNPDQKKVSLQMAVTGIIKPRLEEIFSLIENEIKNSGYYNSIPAGIVLTGGGAQTVNAKEICSQVIPLPLRIGSPPRVGGLVDDILNPAYTSTIGLLLYALSEDKKTTSPGHKKQKINVGGIFDKIKNLIEPLLP